MSKTLSAKCYQENKEKLQKKKPMEDINSNSSNNNSNISNNMDVNLTKISQKMK